MRRGENFLTRNFFELEGLIVARLRAVLPPEVHILTAADLAAVEELAQPVPAVHVLYGGYDTPSPTQPAREKFTQRWHVVVAVSNVSDPGGAAARVDAGPLISKVIAAMGGFVPDVAGAEGFLLTSAPAPRHRNHFSYYPFSWRVDIAYRVIRKQQL